MTGSPGEPARGWSPVPSPRTARPRLRHSPRSAAMTQPSSCPAIAGHTPAVWPRPSPAPARPASPKAGPSAEGHAGGAALAKQYGAYGGIAALNGSIHPVWTDRRAAVASLDEEIFTAPLTVR